jgi:hypothetical protein
MIKRKIRFEYRITCYDKRDVEKEDCPGKVTNWPTPYIKDAPWYEVPVHEDRDRFGTTLDEWVVTMTENFKLLIEDQGEKDCQDITEYLHLCEYEVRVIDYEEIIEAEIPQDVIDRIERLEGLIVDSKKTIKEYEDDIANILAKKAEDRTQADKELLLRLDENIRNENEVIRRFEGEIGRLKKTWKIE